MDRRGGREAHQRCEGVWVSTRTWVRLVAYIARHSGKDEQGEWPDRACDGTLCCTLRVSWVKHCVLLCKCECIVSDGNPVSSIGLPALDPTIQRIVINSRACQQSGLCRLRLCVHASCLAAARCTMIGVEFSATCFSFQRRIRLRGGIRG